VTANDNSPLPAQHISVAIPFYNDSEFLEDCLRIPLMDPRVNDIIINDDHSTDEEWAKLNELLEGWTSGAAFSLDSCMRTRDIYDDLTVGDVSTKMGKVRVERNEHNIRGFRNKVLAVSKAKNDWVYLLDSDNYFTEQTLPCIFDYVDWDPMAFYFPMMALMERTHDGNGAPGPSWDDWNYRRFGYERLDLQKVKHLIHESLKRKPNFGLDGLLNNGNLLVHRHNYCVAAADGFNDPSFTPLAGDGIAQVYLLYRAGLSLQIVPGLTYYHRLHKNSFCETHGQNLGAYAYQIKHAILGLTDRDS
jgi:glycosyltransferase involved in cell wall biosynthesis